MKTLITFLFLAFSGVCFAQHNENVSVFHRLIIYNADNEMMLVKIKDTEIWVTPGFYQDSLLFNKKGLHDIAGTYGMEISNPELKGTFSMRRHNGASTEMLLRNIYSCNYLSGEVHYPKNQSFEIGEIRWLPASEAIPLLSFESIRMFVKQTNDNPDILSGGSISAIRKDDNWNYKVIEEFYPLFSAKKI